MNLPRIAAALLAAALLVAAPAWAGPGHDHDHGDAAPAALGQALPRFAAVSETFELVGVLSGQQITLYLDRFADNSPVPGAQIELEIGGKKFNAEKRGDDEYQVALPETPRPGVLPVTALVKVGDELDLLAGEFDIHDTSHAGEAAHVHSWKETAGWAVAGLAVLGLLVWGGRRLIHARNLRAGAAA